MVTAHLDLAGLSVASTLARSVVGGGNRRRVRKLKEPQIINNDSLQTANATQTVYDKHSPSPDSDACTLEHLIGLVRSRQLCYAGVDALL
jgi:hypothetical protein